MDILEEVAKVIYDHEYIEFRERCRCGYEWDGDHARHVAEELAIAGLLPTIVDYRPHFKEGELTNQTNSESDAQGFVNAVINKDDWEVVRRYVTEWEVYDG